jgi:general secretion pathway protein J
MNRSARSAAGFTLLEVVLAMTLLAMVTAICYAAFHLGVRAVEKGEVVVVAAQRLRVASDVLIRQIKSAVPYPARNADEDVYPYFVGSSSAMTFITAAGLTGGGGLTRVTYRFEDAPPRLVIEESTLFSPDELGRGTANAPTHATTLLDGFRTLKFEYLMNDGADTEWHGGWDGQSDEMLPSAVRILVEGLPGIEGDTWGQEIPIMATTYGDNMGEVDEDSLGAVPPEEGAPGEPDETQPEDQDTGDE